MCCFTLFIPVYLIYARLACNSGTDNDPIFLGYDGTYIGIVYDPQLEVTANVSACIHIVYFILNPLSMVISGG
jgi:hypothetical protein